MDQSDNEDLAKREAHLGYIYQITDLRNQLRKRKRLSTELDEQVKLLENHIATELKEFLNG